MKGHRDILQMLLDAGSEIDAQDKVSSAIAKQLLTKLVHVESGGDNIDGDRCVL